MKRSSGNAASFYYSGYLKPISCQKVNAGLDWKLQYELKLKNFEVLTMFRKIVREWFGQASADYNDFIKAMLLGDADATNEYMNRVALATFSYFDTGSGRGKQTEPDTTSGGWDSRRGYPEVWVCISGEDGFD